MNTEREHTMTERKPITRFDIPRTVQTFLNTAVTLGVLDVHDVFALGATHGDSWTALLDDVMEIAFTGRHNDKGRAAHAALCRVNDAAHAAFHAAALRSDETAA
jgi:hypothetical protein